MEKNSRLPPKHLLAEEIGKPGELEIVSIKTENSNQECSIEAMLHVVGMAWKVEDKNNPGLFIENKDAEIIKECNIGIKRAPKRTKKGIFVVRTLVILTQAQPCFPIILAKNITYEQLPSCKK